MPLTQHLGAGGSIPIDSWDNMILVSTVNWCPLNRYYRGAVKLVKEAEVRLRLGRSLYFCVLIVHHLKGK